MNIVNASAPEIHRSVYRYFERESEMTDGRCESGLLSAMKDR